MADQSLVGAIALTRTLPCLADPGKIIVIGETDVAIDGVLPLLNAILPNVVSYHPFSGASCRRRPWPENASRRCVCQRLSRIGKYTVYRSPRTSCSGINRRPRS